MASFGAGWAQMLNYVVTISISAFFVPHYLSVFWEPLRDEPVGHRRRRGRDHLLVSLNVFGIREAMRVNVVLAVVDFGTQLFLVLLGLALIFKPRILIDNVHLGVAPTWGDFLLAIPIGMIAYTGMETISNLAQETRDPQRAVPARVQGRRRRRLLDLPDAPGDRPHGAAGPLRGRELRDPARAASPSSTGYANDPVLGVVSNLGVHGPRSRASRSTSACSPATILLIAANAGVIGSIAGHLCDVELPAAAAGLQPSAPRASRPRGCR